MSATTKAVLSIGYDMKDPKYLKNFWNWYERTYLSQVTLAAFLFFWQLVHLTWLTLGVVWPRLFGENLWPVGQVAQALIAVVDYFEIPAIATTTALYLNEYRKTGNRKSLLYLVLINSQWLHLFWITDEFVVGSFTGTEDTILPVWIAWIAILIDYLELPVIYDTAKKAVSAIITQEKNPLSEDQDRP